MTLEKAQRVAKLLRERDITLNELKDVEYALNNPQETMQNCNTTIIIHENTGRTLCTINFIWQDIESKLKDKQYGLQSKIKMIEDDIDEL